MPYHRFALLWLCAILLLCVAQCSMPTATSPAPRLHTNRAFYYWKSEFLLSPQQTQALKETGINRLYVKLFDVNWSEQFNRPVPIAPVKFTQPLPDFTSLAPTVFITNQVFANLPDSLVPALADSVYQKILALLPTQHAAPPTEIQIDCDWTGKTKHRFFAFLQALHNLPVLPKPLISVTLRLHQVKYQAQTGIPPADKAMLMFYNMGNFKDPKTQNSILDLQTAKPYLKQLYNYPLPTDIALPLFSWGAVFRNGKFTNLINNLTAQQAQSLPQILQPIGNNRYKALQTTQINGSSLGLNDIVRIEEVTPKQAIQAAQLLNPLLPPTTDTLTITLFHLHPQLFEQFSPEQINPIFEAF